MEANEALRRIFWRHRWLLIALVLIPVVAVAVLRRTEPVSYAATATIQAQAAAPQVDTEATAILSRVTAVATSPAVVQTALRGAGLGGNPVTIAQHQISVSSLSSSAIVTVTVTAPSRPFATQLARSLSRGIVAALNGLGTQSSQQLAALARQSSQMTATRDDLLRRLATAQRARQNATSPAVQSLIAQLNAVETQLAANQTSVQQVLTNSSVNEGAAVISTSGYATSVSRHVASYAALAGLLGLIVGLLIATVRELLRPTVAEPAAAARELSLVLLGRVRLADGEIAEIDDELTARLSLAAHRLGARTLVLTGPVEPAQLTALAADIDGTLPAVVLAPADGAVPVPVPAASREWGVTELSTRFTGSGIDSGSADGRRPAGPGGAVSPHPLGKTPPGLGLRVIALPAVTLGAQPEDPALVLVLPRFAPHAALDQAVDLGVTTGWPLLGVIGLRPPHRRRR